MNNKSKPTQFVLLDKRNSLDFIYWHNPSMRCGVNGPNSIVRLYCESVLKRIECDRLTHTHARARTRSAQKLNMSNLFYAICCCCCYCIASSSLLPFHQLSRLFSLWVFSLSLFLSSIRLLILYLNAFVVVTYRLFWLFDVFLLNSWHHFHSGEFLGDSNTYKSVSKIVCFQMKSSFFLFMFINWMKSYLWKRGPRILRVPCKSKSKHNHSVLRLEHTTFFFVHKISSFWIIFAMITLTTGIRRCRLVSIHWKRLFYPLKTFFFLKTKAPFIATIRRFARQMLSSSQMWFW